MFKLSIYSIREKVIILTIIVLFNLYNLYYDFNATQCPNDDWNLCSPIFLPMELLDLLAFVFIIPVIPWMSGIPGSAPMWVSIYVWLVYFIITTVLAFILGKFICEIVSKFQKKE